LNALRTTAYILVIAVICLIAFVFVAHIAAVGGIYAFNSFQQSHKSTPVPQKSLPQSDGSAAARSVYIVKKGDTATSIARNIGIDPTELLKANKITDPMKLQPGQILKVPQRKS